MDTGNMADIIDSRDVIARIEELEENEERTDEENEELRVLRALARQGEDYISDWQYGEALVRDSYFQEYAQELAEELDLIKPDAAWPYSCIDWERAAEELQQDYTEIDYDGVVYWARS